MTIKEQAERIADAINKGEEIDIEPQVKSHEEAMELKRLIKQKVEREDKLYELAKFALFHVSIGFFICLGVLFCVSLFGGPF